MTKEEVEDLQHTLNQFIAVHRRLGLTKLRIDGEKGELTNRMIKAIKWYVGYLRKNINAEFNSDFVRRLRHPKKVNPEWGASKSAVKRGSTRRRKRRKEVRRNRIKSWLKPGVSHFDGKPVAKCLVPILKWCRANGWRGVLVSGWRDPVYSERLCYQMCGRPSCPGRCAGRSSNHAGCTTTQCAIDVSDYYTFKGVVARCPLKPHIYNDLPIDPVHFSPNGH